MQGGSSHAAGRGYDDEVRAGDRDREQAAAALREHYARGRLTLDELSDRIDQVLAARSRAELRSALSDLPLLPDARELASQGRTVVRAVARGAAVVVFTGAYLLFSLALLLVLGLTMLFQGASASTFLGFLVVWLVPTYLLSRLWHPRPPRRPST